MAVEKHTQIKEKGGIYFFTTRILNCKNLFVTKEYLEVMLQAFKFAEINKKVKTLIRTIMPNHLHWIFKLPDDEDNPITIYQHFNRHTAKEILKLLRLELDTKELSIIPPFMDNTRCNRNSSESLLENFCLDDNKPIYKIWEEKPDLKLLYTSEFIQIKVNYVFENPFRDPWCLVKDPKDYPFTYVDWDLINEFY